MNHAYFCVDYFGARHPATLLSSDRLGYFYQTRGDRQSLYLITAHSHLISSPHYRVDLISLLLTYCTYPLTYLPTHLPTHLPTYLPTYNLLGKFHFSEPLFREAIDTSRSSLGRCHPSSMRSSRLLAHLQILQVIPHSRQSVL